MENYVIYVLKPEALTGIYAKSNQISYRHAEIKLSYGAEYEDQFPKEHLETITHCQNNTFLQL